jgi:3-oxoacyl-[acyl-carrier protein] reductase
MDLRGRAALVTGGAGRIGLETALQFAAAGGAVAINGRDPARLEAAARRIRERAPDAKVATLAADVTDPAACARLIAETEARLGRLDALVHCAMAPSPDLAGPFHATDPGLYAGMMLKTICAVMYVCHAALPALKRAGGGAIVAFPSDAGKTPAPNQTMVGATRAAVMAFFRNLALEASADAVRCNCIAPTYVDSPELRDALAGPHASRIAKAAARARLGLPTPAELAALAVFLCGPAGAHLTGQVISVNGGLNAS